MLNIVVEDYFAAEHTENRGKMIKQREKTFQRYNYLSPGRKIFYFSPRCWKWEMVLKYDGGEQNEYGLYTWWSADDFYSTRQEFKLIREPAKLENLFSSRYSRIQPAEPINSLPSAIFFVLSAAVEALSGRSWMRSKFLVNIFFKNYSGLNRKERIKKLLEN